MPTKLGQNFLTDNGIVEKIIRSSKLKEGDFVLEIGPGKGILTEKILFTGAQLTAIELDKKLATDLKKKTGEKKNLKIIEGNVLDINISEIFPEKENYQVIANIPYYITSKIIRLFLENAHPPKEMILMIQKEVAERIMEKPGKMSLISLSVQYYAEPEILFTVPKEAFSPAPEVESAVIRIIPKKERPSQESAKKIFQIARAGFSSKRKTLLNNLSNSFHLEKDLVIEKLQMTNLSEKTRAQELSIPEWEKLASIF